MIPGPRSDKSVVEPAKHQDDAKNTDIERFLARRKKATAQKKHIVALMSLVVVFRKG